MRAMLISLILVGYSALAQTPATAPVTTEPGTVTSATPAATTKASTTTAPTEIATPKPPMPPSPPPPEATTGSATTATPPESALPSTPAPSAPKMVQAQRRLKKMLVVFEIEINGQAAGTIKAQLFPDKVPKTVDNFVGLVEGEKAFKEFDESKGKLGALVSRPFYDGLTFHRVVPNYVIQGGCPLGNGRGGPGFVIDNEISQDLRHNAPGMLAMANTGKNNTAGSQFYITLRELPHLDGKYAIFGKVIEGMDVVMKIAAVKRDPMSERPLEPVVIKSAKIIRDYAK